MKLKTLKDLRCLKGKVRRTEVKAEAIKWVKEKGIVWIGKDNFYIKENFTLIDWMKFHNITEEDLK